MGRLFGTDGVRGVANVTPLTPEEACRLGRVAGAYLAERAEPGRRRPALLIARDTRVSGPLLEQALVAGILSAGVDALVGGVLPTPAAAYLIPTTGAAGGAVLSASHNPFEDNGVKLFSSDGDKLPDAWEDEIEARLRVDSGEPRPTGTRIGRMRAVPAAERRYLEGLRATLPAGFDLAGLKVVLDCAHGATYRVAPRLFRSLGAEGRTLLVTTQYVGEASYCDMVGLLSDGELLMFDTPQNLRRAAFDGEVIDVEVRQHATAEQIARLRDAPSVIGDIERVDAVTWRIVVRDADEALADMSERLDAVGLELVEATEHVVDYDEAFVRVVERHRNALAEVAS